MRGMLLVVGCLGLSAVAVAAVTPAEFDAAMAANDFGRAEALAKTWAEEEPKNPVPWIRLSLSLHQQKRFAEALEAIQQAEKRGAPKGQVLMRSARAHLGNGDVERAVTLLEGLAGLGFTNKTMLETDPELEPLRKHARFAALVTAVDRNANPCHHKPEYAQFDFWVGEWDVTAAGSPAGSSKVEKILNGCVVQENWTSAGGSSGKSFNLWDREQKRWRQTWVDASGNITDYAGALNAKGEMVFTAHDAWPFEKVHLRMTFTRLNETQVRQLIETSKDKKKWSVAFDGLYTRKPAQAASGAQ